MNKKTNKDPLESHLQKIIKKKSEENKALIKLLKSLEDAPESENESKK